MNKNQLYDIETEMYRKLDAIKAEQKQYNAGIEKGVDMTVSAVRKELGEENQPNEEEQPNNCIYCTFENGAERTGIKMDGDVNEQITFIIKKYVLVYAAGFF